MNNAWKDKDMIKKIKVENYIFEEITNRKDKVEMETRNEFAQN